MCRTIGDHCQKIMNNNTHWGEDFDEMIIELRYVSNGDGRYGDSSPSLSLDLDRLLHSLASQLTHRPIIVQRDRSPSPPSVTSTPMPMMHSQSLPWASCYSEPQPQYPHYYDDRSTWDHALGHSSAVHHNHIHPSPPYVQHQPVQVQASSHVSFPGDLRQPSPDAADDSRLHEYSAKSPRGKELFVSHLPSEMTDDKLRDLFSAYGVVIRASIARHKSGEPRSFAFVKFKHQGNADQALLHLNNYQVSMMFFASGICL